MFSDPVPHPQHLQRAALADLFLDTLNYNAHTTATDALWSGVPLVTVAASDKMQSRVAAGLTAAAGFPDGIVHTLAQVRPSSSSFVRCCRQRSSATDSPAPRSTRTRWWN